MDDKTLLKMKYAFPHTFANHVTDGEFEIYPYIAMIGKKISELIKQGGGKLVVEMMPRSGKSFFISQWVPIWFLEMYPHKKVISATYSADLSREFGRKVRNEFINNPYLTTELDSTATRADAWMTKQGGGMYSAGVGGPLTGRGGNLLLVDDAVKNWDEAASPTYRQRNVDWMKTTLLTRGEPNAVFVILMTRWHEQDLAGVMQQEGGWEVMRFPAIAEDNDILGRKVGMALNPKRYGIERLDEIRKALGSKFFSAMYQQRPSPEDGDIFKRHWFKYYKRADRPQQFDAICQSWDMAFKDTKGSAYVVGQVWGRKGANFYLIDQIRDKLNFTESCKAVINLTNKYPDVKAKLIEDKANGPAIINTLKGKVSGIIPLNPRGSKEARAYATQPLLEAGNIFLPDPTESPWVEDFLEECVTFPNSDYKDQVDSFTQACDYLGEKNKLSDINILGITKTSTWL